MNQRFENEGGTSSEDPQGNVYRDWELLWRIDLDLRDLAIRYGFPPLDDIPDDLEPEPRRLAQIKRRVEVDAICREQARRARIAKQDRERRTRENDIQTELFPPDSWQELTARVFCPGSSLECYVRGRVMAYGRSQGLREEHQDDVVNAVMGHMYYFILRNAGTWYRKRQELLKEQENTPDGKIATGDVISPQTPAPKPGDSWWGYVKREADGRVKREVKRQVAEDRGYDQSEDQREDRGTREKSWLSDFDPEQLKQAIADLPPDERKVVLLWLAGKTFDEIGQELSIPTSRVKVLWSRALGMLREWLELKQAMASLSPDQREQTIANLTPDERKVILLWWAGKTFDEIRQKLGVETDVARTLWSQALGRLRKWLAPAIETPTQKRWADDLKRWKAAANNRKTPRQSLLEQPAGDDHAGLEANNRKKPWESLLDRLCPEHKKVIDLFEQGRSPADIAADLGMSPEKMDEFWYRIGTAVLQAIEAEESPPEPGA